jgi:hypothetical protein
MNTNQGVLQAKQFLRSVDWRLLVFLVLVFNVKLVVKLLAIILIYLWRPGFKFGFRKNNSRLPMFYPAAIAIAFINLLLWTPDIKNYLPSFVMGIGFWLICILTIHQLKLFVEKNKPETIHKTLAVFFLLNAVISLITLAGIMIETGSINPYTYQGEFQKYFISTGDYIKGISFDTCTTNAVINAFGALYFFTRKNFSFFLVCVIMMVLTGSNLVNLVFAGALLFIFISRSSRAEKSIIVVSLMMIVIFLTKVSPQNNQYINESIARIFKEKTTTAVAGQQNTAEKPLSWEESRILTARTYLDSVNKILQAKLQVKKDPEQPEVSYAIGNWQEKPGLPQANIHTAPYQHRDDTLSRKELIEFAASLPTIPSPVIQQKRLPGKLLGMKQTIACLKDHPARLLTGMGMGNFSSKLAFKSTGLNIAGGFPERFIHIDAAFAGNHLPLYLSFFTSQERYHSVIHSPNSVYDQMLSEYGLAGLLAVIFLYFGFFLKQAARLSYGIPLLIMTAGLFFTEYWFEQMSVLFLLELLLFLNIKEGRHG